MRNERKQMWGLGLALLASLSWACGHGKSEGRIDRRPQVDMGVGATILYPGQAPPMPNASGPGGTYGTNSGPGGGSNLSYIGGAGLSEEGAYEGGNEVGTRAYRKHPELRQHVPVWAKVAAAPFALAIWPFKKVGELLGAGQEEPEAPTPSAAPPGTTAAPGVTAAPAPAPLDPQQAYEQAQLEALERQLASRPPAGASADTSPTRDSGSAASPEAWTPPVPAPSRSGRTRTIAEELAALQAGIAPRPRPETMGRPGEPSEPPMGVADRVLDRDGDGRPDRWQYHDEAGRPTRELLDENGDGAPDRTLVFDVASGRELRAEEDTNLDGRIDSWIDYREGQIARHRRDTDYDGFLDTWTFYRDGELARQEQDLNADGFRDRVAFYEQGRLLREREDRDGDGRVDRVTTYDAEERPSRRDEDSDGDGLIDVRSEYSEGRLVRRELLSAEAGTAIEEEDLRSTAWSAGEESAASDMR